jgi:zinc resistance-associated protein
MSRWLSALLGGVVLVATAVVFWTASNQTNITPPVSPSPTPVTPAPVPPPPAQAPVAEEAAPSPPPPAAAAAAATLSASGFAITAATQSDQQPTHAELVQRWAEAALDGQLKRMKTSLRLSADREKLWDPFESAVKDGGRARVVALQKEQGDNLSPMDRLTAKADRLAESGANLEKVVGAAEPLYATLDDAQKHRFITLGRTLVPERGRFAKEMRHLRMGEGDQHGAEQ